MLARFVPFDDQTCIDVPSLYPQLSLQFHRVTYTKTYMTSSRYDCRTLTAYTYGRNDVIFARDRNQKWLLSTIRKEFRERHFLTR